MRGLAALAVAAFHADYLFGQGVLPSSYLAVDLFFILSGFVIARAYGGKLDAGLTPAKFMRIRLGRLYPLYLLSVLASLPLLALWAFKGSEGGVYLALVLVTALLFLPSPVHDAHAPAYPLNGPAWSLFFELAVNLLAASLWRHLSLRKLCWCVGLAIPPLIAVALVNGSLNGGVAWDTFYVAGSRVLFGFFAGALLQKLPLKAPKANPLLLVAVLVPIFLADPPTDLRPYYDLVIAIVVFPLVVAMGAEASPTAGISRMFTYAGEISYPLYVLHTPVYRVFRTVAKGVIEPGVVAGICGLMVAVACAALANLADTALRRRLARGSSRSAPQLQAKP